MPSVASFNQLLTEIRACRNCEEFLPLGPRPVVTGKRTAPIILAGQAPGTKVHASGIPWNDPSGDRLRDWLGMDREFFYNESLIAVVPIGFCYPGKGARGDLPPRPECAELWMDKLMGELVNVKLILSIGLWSQKYHLGKARKKTLAETVKHWESYLDRGIIPLPHPSPRNIMWRRKHPWFEAEVVPAVRQKVWEVLEGVV